VAGGARVQRCESRPANAMAEREGPSATGGVRERSSSLSRGGAQSLPDGRHGRWGGEGEQGARQSELEAVPSMGDAGVLQEGEVTVHG
jgi:hypothetical protein